VVLHGAAAALAAERGVAGWRVSLTHTRTMAEAVAVALAG
jgi:phosphopantetheinyl transferase (holo-ACP synthase)